MPVALHVRPVRLKLYPNISVAPRVNALIAITKLLGVLHGSWVRLSADQPPDVDDTLSQSMNVVRVLSTAVLSMIILEK